MQKLDKLAVLENEMVMERVKLAKMSWNSVTSHGILPILSLNFTNFTFFANIKKFSISSRSLHFPTFSARFEQKDGH